MRLERSLTFQGIERGNQRKNLYPDYDVALSFAGENREYVDQGAEFLKETGLRVFYDRFEEANLRGKILYEHPPYL